jgi:hypothetical protein
MRNHGTGQDDGRSRTVSGGLVRLFRSLNQKRGAEIFGTVGKYYTAGYGRSVIRDKRNVVFLVEGDVTPLGSECRRDCVGNFVHAAKQTLCGIGIKINVFAHINRPQVLL